MTGSARNQPAAAQPSRPGRLAVPPARPDPLFHTVLLVMCTGALLLAALFSVQEGSRVVVPLVNVPLPELCWSRRLLGLGCPGCGLTRCFISLAHGDVSAAWAYNPTGLLLFGLAAVQVPYRAAQLWRIRRGLPELGAAWLAPVSLAALAIALVSQWVVRLVSLAG